MLSEPRHHEQHTGEATFARELQQAMRWVNDGVPQRALAHLERALLSSPTYTSSARALSILAVAQARSDRAHASGRAWALLSDLARAEGDLAVAAAAAERAGLCFLRLLVAPSVATAWFAAAERIHAERGDGPRMRACRRRGAAAEELRRDAAAHDRMWQRAIGRRIVRMARVPAGGLVVVRGAEHVEMIDTLVRRKPPIDVVVLDHDADRIAALHDELDRRGRGASLRTFAAAPEDLVVAAPDAVLHLTSSTREAAEVVAAADAALVLGGRIVSVLTVPDVLAGPGEVGVPADADVWFEPFYRPSPGPDAGPAIARFATGIKALRPRFDLLSASAEP